MLFSFLSFFFILFIHNAAKISKWEKIKEPGNTGRKSKKPAPGTRRYFSLEKSLKTRILLVKSGGLAAMVCDPIYLVSDHTW